MKRLFDATRIPEPVRAAIGLVVLLGGVISSIRAALQSSIDYTYLQLTGLGVLTGTNIYADAGKVGLAARHGLPPLENEMFYPPATGFAMLPWAFLPHDAGRIVWFVFMNAVLVAGVRALVRVALPEARPWVFWLAAGIVLGSSGVRWAMILLQGAPLMLGLLGLFVAALASGRSRWAMAIAIYATVFKMTLALPFGALLLLHRRWLGVCLVGGSWALLNVLGFAWMGDGALASYRANVAGLQSVTDPGNIDSPDPWLAVSRPRTDWVSFFYGVSHSMKVAEVANLVLTALVAVFLLREGMKLRTAPSLATTSAFLGPLVCLGSLCVYHHHYDANQCLAPLLLLVLLRPAAPRWTYLSWLPLALVLLFLPVGMVQNILVRLLGDAGAPLLKLMFPVVISLALAGSLAALKRQLALQQGRVGGT